MGEKIQNKAATTPCDNQACCFRFGNRILHIVGNRTCSSVGIARRKVARGKSVDSVGEGMGVTSAGFA